MKWKGFQINGHTGIRVFIALALCFAVLAGCSQRVAEQPEPGKASKPAAQDEPAEMKPVTLRFMPNGTSKSDDFYQQIIVSAVKAKYPQITLEKYDVTYGDDMYQKMLASGDIPDILGDWYGALASLNALGLPTDLTPYVKKYNSDLSRFMPHILDAMRSPDGKLLALPYALNFNTMYVNKDVFDKFGVAYPKDGLTWDETIELARKVSRSDDGTEYRGLSYENTLTRLLMPVGILSGIDMQTNKANASSEPYRKIFDLALRINSIPGNTPDEGGARNNFMKKKNIAMLTTVGALTLNLIAGQADNMNWDLAQFPSYPGMSSTGIADAHHLFISSQSKHKDEAFRVIDLISSLDVQRKMVSTFPSVSPLQDAQVVAEFGSQIPALKGKNVQSIFKTKGVLLAPVPELQVQSTAILNKKLTDMIKGKDINTGLREADDEINQLLNAQAAK